MKSCNACGKCCDTAGNGGLSATAQEIDWWESNRPEIARFVSDGKIWVDPATNEYFPVCPWLQRMPGESRTVCQIYLDRPEDCRHYPVDIEQMARHGCEMLEPADLRDTRKAQARLDLLMSDSRPPAGR
jgi:Fe-S-cluster containining protein